MLSIYLIIAVVCAALLIAAVALGGFVQEVDVGGGDVDVGGPDLDVGGHDVDIGAGVDYGDFGGPGVSPLSLPIILAFGTTFGGVGALLEYGGIDPFIVPLVAIAVSIVIAAAMYFAVVWLFVKTQATSVVDIRKLIGEKGTVSVAIKSGKVGQIVVVTTERGRTLVPAVADVPIPVDAVVVVKKVIGNSVKVERE